MKNKPTIVILVLIALLFVQNIVQQLQIAKLESDCKAMHGTGAQSLNKL